MDTQDTPVVGRFLGLPLPEGVDLHLWVRPSTCEQFEDLLEAARDQGLLVKSTDSGRQRWIVIESGVIRMTVFCPDGFMGEGAGAETFDEFIDRKMKDRKFIEVAA